MIARVLLAACLTGLTQAGTQPGSTAAKSHKELAQVAFMTGAWRGTTEDGIFEEHWSGAEGNNVMGMFRWVKNDGTPIMFEMLAMTKEPDGLYMRVKHFNGKLVSREEKEDAVTLKLAESGPTRAVFKGVESEKRVAAAEYEKTDKGLHITIRFTDDKRPALNFDLARVVP